MTPRRKERSLEGAVIDVLGIRGDRPTPVVTVTHHVRERYGCSASAGEVSRMLISLCHQRLVRRTVAGGSFQYQLTSRGKSVRHVA